ncbi:zinc ribbon domain-containing protein, partial [Methanoregula sp.]|uniref:zinc ribbon domain-containing protein n=1 Tax=Methanoregula sp. TaxID=2052170 RepID=UPI000CC394BE
MQDPVPPEKNPFTCPACSSPVKPGDKFCEACGAKIPALFTCTKCGTQFVHFKEQCELCGGSLVLGDGSVPGTPAQPAREEKTVTVKRAAGDPSPDDTEEGPLPESLEDAGDAEVITVKTKVSHRHAEPEEEPEQDDEPEPGEVTEQDDEEEPVEEYDETPAEVTRPARKMAQERPSQEIVEPDTDELLELYGKEYDPDETLESHRRSPGVSRKERAAKEPAAAPAKRSSVKVDDALLLSLDGQPEKKAQKPRRGRSGLLMAGLVAAVIVAAVIFIALPSLTSEDNAGSQSSVTIIEETPVRNVSPTGTPTPSRACAFLPQPTQTLHS